MTKTLTPAEALQAEMAALRQADEDRIKRVRRIEALQLPIAAEVLNVLHTKTVTEALELLPEMAANLTDNMQAVITNLVAQMGYARNVLDSETARIGAQIEADRAAEAEAKALAEAGTGQ